MKGLNNSLTFILFFHAKKIEKLKKRIAKRKRFIQIMKEKNKEDNIKIEELNG